MTDLTADQIVERIANANETKPAIMRQKVENVIQSILTDMPQSQTALLADTFSGQKPSVDELIVALEHWLYDILMPTFPGWVWDGDGYRNIELWKNF